MMRHLSGKLVALAGILAVMLMACGEVDLGGPEQSPTNQREQAVTVVPEFSISGTSDLPKELHLSNLGLTISEIRLEPIDEGHDSVAYSTRVPTALNFNVERGETVKLGDPVELPKDGRYLVSVRLEPIAEVVETASGSSEQIIPSFSVAGFVAGNGVVKADPRYDGKRSDGSPVPVPFDEDDDDETSSEELTDTRGLPGEWTPFHYDSRRSVFFTLNEVELRAGRQLLSFEFDVHDWALELVDPLLSAIKHNDDLGADAGDGVDVTSPLESTGHGAEALFQSTSVRVEAAR